MEETCKHEKAYANFILATYPPQYPWVCRVCGETGTDRDTPINRDEYNEIIKRLEEEKKHE